MKRCWLLILSCLKLVSIEEGGQDNSRVYSLLNLANENNANLPKFHLNLMYKSERQNQVMIQLRHQFCGCIHVCCGGDLILQS